MDYSNLNDLKVGSTNDESIGRALIKDFLNGYVRPKLGVALKQYLDIKPEEEQKEEFIKAVEDVFKKYKRESEPQKHIKIEVTATPEEIEEHKMTVTFTALDDMGVEWVKEMNQCQQD